MKPNFLLPALLFLLPFQCSIRVPEITVTGGSSPLEKQLLGSFKQLEEGVQVIRRPAAVDRFVPRQNPNGNSRFLQALRNRNINRQAIDELKKLKLIGEQNDGMLAIVDPAKMATNPELQARVQQLIIRENEERSIILDYLYARNAELNEEKKRAIASIFARINYENSPSGTFIQDDNGQWVKKE